VRVPNTMPFAPDADVAHAPCTPPEKAKDLQEQMELAKREQEAATKAQIDMAALLSSQRDKYEEAVAKLCHELAETKAQLAEMAQRTVQMQAEQQQQQQPEKQQQESSTPVEPSPELIQKLKQQFELEFMAKLQGLEADWNGKPPQAIGTDGDDGVSDNSMLCVTEVMTAMEAKLTESKSLEREAIVAQERIEAQLADRNAQLESCRQELQAERETALNTLSSREAEWKKQEIEWQGECSAISS